jgi:hypothetical protein
MKNGFGELCLISISLVTMSLISCAQSAIASSGVLDRWEKILKVQIQTSGESFPVRNINGRNPDVVTTNQYLTVFLPEISLYEPSALKKSGLRRIVLCQGLSVSGQQRAAVPDFRNQTLYLDVSRGSFEPMYVRNSIHHDIFHMIDQRDDGSLDRDDKWKSFNPKGFKYGSGGEYAQNDSTAGLITNDRPGFLNRYSTTAVEEDKAVIYANMVVNTSMIQKRIQTDPTIKLKVNRIKDLLKLFDSSFNAQFWLKAAKVERSSESSVPEIYSK